VSATPQFELPMAGPAAPAPPSAGPGDAARERRQRLAKRVRLLSWLSLVWMTVEGVVAILAGVAASSIALVGFGLDSAVEGFASVIIIWRFTGHRVFSHAAEERAQKLVAVQFFLLAPYVGIASLRALIGGEHPDETLVGILLALGSVVFMPLLGVAKQRLADQLGSALLVGLLGNALAGAWWLDAVVGLLIAALAVKEGREAWRGEGCCVSGSCAGAAGVFNLPSSTGT